MATFTLGLRAAALSTCAALSLAGFVGLAAPAQAFPLTSAGVSSAGRGIDVVQYSRVGARSIPPGRHYARRAGLYTCGATNTHTHLNGQACCGGNKMQTYAR